MIYHCGKNPNIICEEATQGNINPSCENCIHNGNQEEKIKIELSKAEFNMLVEKLSWMRCVVRDSDLRYKDYCNGNCNECTHPELHDFKNWLKSKIIQE